ncbi:unnamed protein product, partial [Darwinula stevensoni]
MAKFNTMWDREGDPSKKFETRFKVEKNGARIDVEYPGRVVVLVAAIDDVNKYGKLELSWNPERAVILEVDYLAGGGNTGKVGARLSTPFVGYEKTEMYLQYSVGFPRLEAKIEVSMFGKNQLTASIDGELNTSRERTDLQGKIQANGHWLAENEVTGSLSYQSDLERRFASIQANSGEKKISVSYEGSPKDHFDSQSGSINNKITISSSIPQIRNIVLAIQHIHELPIEVESEASLDLNGAVYKLNLSGRTEGGKHYSGSIKVGTPIETFEHSKAGVTFDLGSNSLSGNGEFAWRGQQYTAEFAGKGDMTSTEKKIHGLVSIRGSTIPDVDVSLQHDFQKGKFATKIEAGGFLYHPFRLEDATFDVELRGGKIVTAHFEIDNRNTEVMTAKFNTMWDREGDPSKKFETRFKVEKNGARIDVEYPGRVVVLVAAIDDVNKYGKLELSWNPERAVILEVDYLAGGGNTGKVGARLSTPFVGYEKTEMYLQYSVGFPRLEAKIEVGMFGKNQLTASIDGELNTSRERTDLQGKIQANGHWLAENEVTGSLSYQSDLERRFASIQANSGEKKISVSYEGSPKDHFDSQSGSINNKITISSSIPQIRNIVLAIQHIHELPIEVESEASLDLNGAVYKLNLSGRTEGGKHYAGSIKVGTPIETFEHSKAGVTFDLGSNSLSGNSEFSWRGQQYTAEFAGKGDMTSTEKKIHGLVSIRGSTIPDVDTFDVGIEFGNSRNLRVHGSYEFSASRSSLNATLLTPIQKYEELSLTSFYEKNPGELFGSLGFAWAFDKQIALKGYWQHPIDLDLSFASPFEPVKDVRLKIETTTDNEGMGLDATASWNGRRWSLGGKARKDFDKSEFQALLNVEGKEIRLVSSANLDTSDANFDLALTTPFVGYEKFQVQCSSRKTDEQLTLKYSFSTPFEEARSSDFKADFRYPKRRLDGEVSFKYNEHQLGGNFQVDAESDGVINVNAELETTFLAMKRLSFSAVGRSSNNWQNAEMEASLNLPSSQHKFSSSYNADPRDMQFTLKGDTPWLPSGQAKFNGKIKASGFGNVDASLNGLIDASEYGFNVRYALENTGLKVEIEDRAVSKLFGIPETSFRIHAEGVGNSGLLKVNVRKGTTSYEASGQYSLTEDKFQLQGEIQCPNFKNSLSVEVKHDGWRKVDTDVNVTGTETHIASMKYNADPRDMQLSLEGNTPWLPSGLAKFNGKFKASDIGHVEASLNGLIDASEYGFNVRYALDNTGLEVEVEDRAVSKLFGIPETSFRIHAEGGGNSGLLKVNVRTGTTNYEASGQYSLTEDKFQLQGEIQFPNFKNSLSVEVKHDGWRKVDTDVNVTGTETHIASLKYNADPRDMQLSLEGNTPWLPSGLAKFNGKVSASGFGKVDASLNGLIDGNEYGLLWRVTPRGFHPDWPNSTEKSVHLASGLWCIRIHAEGEGNSGLLKVNVRTGTTNYEATGQYSLTEDKFQLRGEIQCPNFKNPLSFSVEAKHDGWRKVDTGLTVTGTETHIASMKYNADPRDLQLSLEGNTPWLPSGLAKFNGKIKASDIGNVDASLNGLIHTSEYGLNARYALENTGLKVEVEDRIVSKFFGIPETIIRIRTEEEGNSGLLEANVRSGTTDYEASGKYSLTEDNFQLRGEIQCPNFKNPLSLSVEAKHDGWKKVDTDFTVTGTETHIVSLKYNADPRDMQLSLEGNTPWLPSGLAKFNGKVSASGFSKVDASLNGLIDGNEYGFNVRYALGNTGLEVEVEDRAVSKLFGIPETIIRIRTEGEGNSGLLEANVRTGTTDFEGSGKYSLTEDKFQLRGQLRCPNFKNPLSLSVEAKHDGWNKVDTDFTVTGTETHIVSLKYNADPRDMQLALEGNTPWLPSGLAKFNGKVSASGFGKVDASLNGLIDGNEYG